MEKLAHLRIPFEDIIQATNNFATEHVIGRGDFGSVYKEVLARHEGFVTVAIKRLDSAASGQGLKEFLTEINILSIFRHDNIISLVGFCYEGVEKILVLEFAIHGSLDKHLSSAKLTWLMRLQICLDAARGVKYLHNPSSSQHRMIHRDLKSSNILIDKNWHAKIADIGLSKLGRANESVTYLITSAGGTLGYVDPEYFDSGILTKESDIYSFGVILMEVLCGRLAYLKGEDYVGPLAYRLYEDGKLTEIIDPILRTQVILKQDPLQIHQDYKLF